MVSKAEKPRVCPECNSLIVSGDCCPECGALPRSPIRKLTGSQNLVQKSKRKFLTSILKYLSYGWSQKDIADKLKTSKQRINYYVKRLEAWGFILADYRSSQKFYHVYMDAWLNYCKEQEVKEKRLTISIHFFKIRFPLERAPAWRVPHNCWVYERDGVRVRLSNRSILVWVPRFVLDRFGDQRLPIFNMFSYAGVVAYQVAFKWALKLQSEIDPRKLEVVSPVHVAADTQLDFSRGVLEIEKLIRWKTRYELGDSEQERIDRYIS